MIPYVSNEVWFVRVQAAKALGHVGILDDAGILEPALSDQHWWVRYRAAQAIRRLPRMTEEKFKRFIEKQIDRFARDILVHVGAEWRIQST